MSYKNISKNEARLLNMIDGTGLTVFGFSEIRALTGWDTAKINNILQSLLRKDIVNKLKKNSYVLSEVLRERAYKVATELVKPSYISYWTALSYYGFTEQQVETVQLVSTRQVEDIEHPSIKIETTTLKPYRFYGYRKDDFSIAEKEKALVDSLHKPDKVGGLEEFIKCLSNAWDEINRDRFVDYLLKFRNRSMVSRAGYLLQRLGLEFDGFGRLQQNISKSYVKLLPSEAKKSNYDSRWNIIINKEVPV